MRPASRLRAFVALCVIALLLPFSAVHAAPVLELAAPQAADTFLPLPGPTIPELERPSTTPVLYPDEGLEALGGPAGLQKLMAERLEAYQAKAASAAPPKLQRYTPPARRPTGTPADKAAATPATSASGLSGPAGPQPAATGPKIDVAPRQAVGTAVRSGGATVNGQAGTDQSQAAPAFQSQGYTLTLDKELFQVGEQATITFTLTSPLNQPVAGARIRIGDPGLEGVLTDANGVAQITYTGASYNRIDPVWVTTDTLGDTVLAEVYTLESDFGVLVIDQVTERNNQPVNDFYGLVYNWYSIWGRPTQAGRLSVIVPSGESHVEVLISQNQQNPESYYLYQPVTVGAGQKVGIHPSGSGTVQLQVTASLDGAALTWGSLFLRNQHLPWDSYSHALSTTVWVTPYYYNVTWYTDGTEAFLYPAVLDVNGNAQFAITTWRNELSTIALQGQNGQGNSEAYSQVILMAGGTRVHTGSTVTSLLARPYVDYRLNGYRDYVSTAEADWEYTFWPQGRNSFNLSGPGQQYILDLGGPLQNGQPYRGCPKMASCELKVPTYLITPQGDHVQFWRDFRQMLQGTIRVQRPDGVVDTRNINSDSWHHESFPIPAGLYGDYLVQVDWPDLGPYQPPYHGEWTITVEAPVEYRLTLSPDVIKSNTPTEVTATLTRNGTPAGGVGLEFSGGTFYQQTTTDGNGQAKVTVNSPYRDTIAVWAATPEYGYRNLASLYVLEDGYGLLRITGVTDRNGSSLSSFRANVHWVGQDGSFDGQGMWADTGTMTLVRPAGRNYVEMAAPAWQQPGTQDRYFLYKEVDVTAGATTEVILSGADTVPLEVAATLDGQSLSGWMLLHNQALPAQARSRPDTDLPAGPVYVTPGTYTVTFYSSGPATILTRENVSAQAGSRVDFTETSAGLTPLTFAATDGRGNPVQATNTTLRTPTAVLWVDAAQNPLATAGLPYAVEGYELQGSNPSWRFHFYNTEQHGSLAVPGQPLAINLGGPLKVDPVPVSELEAGQEATFRAPLVTAQGDRHEVTWAEAGYYNPMGAAYLTDQYGGQWWSGNYFVDRPYLSLWLPNTTGQFTMNARWHDLEPYQAQATGSYQFSLQQHFMELKLTPAFVPAGQATRVTVQAVRNGQPVANAQIDAGELGWGYTDQEGKFFLDVPASGRRAYALHGYEPYGGPPARATVFVLDPGYAGVEITGIDANSQPLMDFYAAVESSGPNWHGRYSTYSWAGLAAAIVPAGGNGFVELTAQWSPSGSYVLHAPVNLNPDQVVRVRLDGTAARPVTFSTTLDGQFRPDTRAYFAPAGANYPSYRPEVPLDWGMLRMTPGTYDTLLSIYDGSRIWATFPGRSYDGGEHAFAIDRSSMARLTVDATYGGFSTGNFDYSFQTGRFVFSQAGNSTAYVSPGTYWVTQVNTQVQQPWGDWWTYMFTHDSPPAFKLQAGQDVLARWPMEITSSKVKATPVYKPGSRVDYSLNLSTEDGWRLQRVRNQNWGTYESPVHTTVTDPSGMPVHEADSYDAGGSWQVPPAPARSYKITMNRNLGALGWHEATAVTRRAPANLRLRLDREVVQAGTRTVVRGTLTGENGEPVPNAWIQVFGETFRWERTNARGQFALNLTPTRAGEWQLVHWDYSIPEQPAYVSTVLYALADGYGLLDVDARDTAGAPLPVAMFRTAGSPSVYGWSTNTEVKKLLVPAGPATVILRGMGAAGENYYLIGEATVPDRDTATLALDPSGAIPVTFQVTGAGAADVAEVTLRNQTLPYREWDNLPGNLLYNGQVWVSPGSYEALVTLTEPGVTTLLPTQVPATPSAITVNVDAAAATARLDLGAPGLDGQAASYVATWIAAGGTGRFLAVKPGMQLRLVPGTYTLTQGNVELTAGDTRWQYSLSGSTSLTLGDGETHSFLMGQALSARVTPERPAVSVNTTTTLKGAAYDSNGFAISSVSVFRGDSPQGWEPNRLEVIGGGGTKLLTYLGTRVRWDVPANAGLYQLKFSVETGPLGGTVTGDGSVTVVRPHR